MWVAVTDLLSTYPGFANFLDAFEESEQGSDARFVGRNFKLDERLPQERVATYGDVAESSLSDLREWYVAHGDYCAAALQIEQPPGGLPRDINPEDAGTCAESFRFDGASESVGRIDPSVDLVRVERLSVIADAAGVLESGVIDRFTLAAPPHRDPDAKRWADAVLGRWSRTRDLRPCWTTFWEDCADALESGRSDDGWADEMASRLGLAHLDPLISGRPIPIVVFRYPVRIVPTRSGSAKHRALAYPTVLDGPFSTAFCPAPREMKWGRAVDLRAEGHDPRRELIHPPVRLHDEHLWKVGVLEGQARASLGEARGLHVVWLQLQCDRTDFGHTTDRDLL
jgi:hypothetical protein